MHIRPIRRCRTVASLTFTSAPCIMSVAATSTDFTSERSVICDWLRLAAVSHSAVGFLPIVRKLGVSEWASSCGDTFANMLLLLPPPPQSLRLH